MERYNHTHARNSLQESVQWITVFGMFFMNRIEGLLIISSVLYIFFCRSRLYHSSLFFPLLLFGVFEFLLIFYLDYDSLKFTQQLLLIALFILCYEQIFINTLGDVRPFFLKFIKLSYFISLIGLAQVVIYFFFRYNIMNFLFGMHGTAPLGNSLIRATSTLSEGGYLGTILIPALLYSFYYQDPYHVLGGRRFVILAAALLSVSPFAYIAIIFCLLFRFTNMFFENRWLSIGLLVALLSVAVPYIPFHHNSKSIKSDSPVGKIVDSMDLLNTISAGDRAHLASYNVSTAVFGTSLYIAMNAPSRLVGTGLGTHRQNFEKMTNRVMSREASYARLNIDDGYSLSLRILSELGVVGLGLYVLLIIYCFNKDNLINICMLAIIIAYFLRGGSYVNYGTIFVHFMYYYTSKHYVSPIEQLYNKLNSKGKNEGVIHHNSNL